MTDAEREDILDSYRVVSDSRDEPNAGDMIIVKLESPIGHRIIGEMKFDRNHVKYFASMCVLKPDFSRCPRYSESGNCCVHMYPSKDPLESWWAVQCFDEVISNFVIRRGNLEDEFALMKMEEM